MQNTIDYISKVPESERTPEQKVELEATKDKLQNLEQTTKLANELDRLLQERTRNESTMTAEQKLDFNKKYAELYVMHQEAGQRVAIVDSRLRNR